MKIFSKILISTVLFFSVIPVFSQSDPYEQVFFLAQKLDQSGAVNEAFVEYKRYLFLQDFAEGTHQKETYIALSLFYKNNSQYQKAIDYIQLAQNYESTDELKLEEINLLRKYSVEKKINLESNVSLYKFRYLPEYTPATKKAAWIAILENEVILEDFDLFETNLAQVIADFPDLFSPEQLESIEANLKKIRKFKPKSPMLAMHLSFIPGLGQLYAGNPKDALNAFVLNGSLIALSAYSLSTLNFADFALFELNPTIRFYKGNLYNAQKEVYEYNGEKMLKLKSPILEILQ